MARRRRLEAALRRLRRGGDEPVPANPPAPEPAPAVPSEPPGGAQLTLGELSASRREAAAVRLRALRERAPTQPPPPPPPPPPGSAAPTGRGAAPGPGGGGPGWRERLAAALDGARLRVADAGAAVGQRWRELPSIARQRIAAVAIVAVVAAIVVWVLIPAAPCGAPGGSSCPAEDDAIALVPADALGYAHVEIGSGERPAAAAAFADRLPLLSGLLLGSVSEVAGERVDFGSQVAPWAGDEVALAVLPVAPSGAAVTMIEAADPDAAQRFADATIGPTKAERAGGVSVAVGTRGRAAALIDGFLLVGDEAAVRAMIADDGGGSLETAAAAAGIDELPDDSYAYGYLSGDGARALFAGDRRLAGLDGLINARGSSAVVAALSFDGGLASLTVRSAQDPDSAAADPSPVAALPRFEPSLDADVGPDALAYLGLGEPAATAEALPGRLMRALAGPLGRVGGDLGDSGVAQVGTDLLPLLGGEAALTVEPVAGPGAAPTPGVLAPAGVPYVSLIADGVDAADLDELQRPLAAALAPDGAGFEPLQIAGVEAQSLTVSSDVELTYATFDDRLVVATKPIGIAQARAGGDGLAGSDDYRAVTSAMPTEVSALLYLDLRDLLSLGEQIGLAEDPAYARLAPDLRTLQAAALSVTDSGTELRTDVSVALGEAPDAAASGAD